MPVWTRSNGPLTLVIARIGYDPSTGGLVGYPYGTLPRLLLFWMNSEAVRKKSRRLELGHSLAGFMRQLGLNPGNGTGKRSDARRLREQMDRLFSASIHFQLALKSGQHTGTRMQDMRVSSASELWWNPRQPGQDALWGSWVELGEAFYDAITASPVPLDMRALRALKRSPLALDLYSLLNYRAFVATRKRASFLLTWAELERQLGSDYTNPEDFRKKVLAALVKIRTVLPGLLVERVPEGFLVLPGSKAAIKPRDPVEN